MATTEYEQNDTASQQWVSHVIVAMELIYLFILFIELVIDAEYLFWHLLHSQMQVQKQKPHKLIPFLCKLGKKV